jgi:hypothetical protein
MLLALGMGVTVLRRLLGSSLLAAVSATGYTSERGRQGSRQCQTKVKKPSAEEE